MLDHAERLKDFIIECKEKQENDALNCFKDLWFNNAFIIVAYDEIIDELIHYMDAFDKDGSFPIVPDEKNQINTKIIEKIKDIESDMAVGSDLQEISYMNDVAFSLQCYLDIKKDCGFGQWGIGDENMTRSMEVMENGVNKILSNHNSYYDADFVMPIVSLPPVVGDNETFDGYEDGGFIEMFNIPMDNHDQNVLDEIDFMLEGTFNSDDE